MSTRTIIRTGLAAVAAVALGATLISAPANADTDPTITDAYTLTGTSYIGAIKTTVKLGPTTLTDTLDANTLGIVSGTLPLPSQVVQFNALGFVPIRATVSFTEATPITGSLNIDSAGNTTVSTTTSYTIKLSNVSAQVLGFWVPLSVGNNCQTAKPAVISSATPKGQQFDVVNGGQLTGKYTIGSFQNCSALNIPFVGSLLVNALVPGSNNTVNLTLSDGHFAGS